MRFTLLATLWLIVVGAATATPQPPAVVESVEADKTPAAEPPPNPAEQQFKAIQRSIKQAQQSQQRIQSLRSEIDAVPAKMKAAKEEIAAPQAIEVSATVQSVEELQTLLTDLRARLQNAETEAAALTTKPSDVQKRLVEIPAALSAAEQELAELETLAASRTSEPDEDNATAAALTREQILSLDPNDATEEELRAAQLQSRMAELRTTIDALQTEREFYKATAGLIPLQQAVNERRLSLLRTQIERTSSEVDRKKQIEVDRQNDRLQDAVSMVPPTLKDLAQANVDLAEQQQRLNYQIASVREQVSLVETAQQQVSNDLTSARERIESVGLTDALGLLLRRKREQNQSLRFKIKPQQDYREAVANYQIETFQLQDEQKELIDTGIAAVPKAQLAEPVNWSQLDEKQAYELLIGRRRTLLIEALQTLETLTTLTLDADIRRRQLLQNITEYSDFVDGHLFWIRSAPAAGRADLSQFDEAAKWLLDGERWLAVTSHVLSTALVMPLRVVSLLLFAGGMVLMRGRMRREIAAVNSDGRRGRISMPQTFGALVWTMASAAVWPTCFGVAAGVILMIPSGEPMVRGVGLGLVVTTLYVASREMLKESCRQHGLGDAHFGWSTSVRKLVRRHLLWYTSIGGVSVFLLGLYHEHPDTLLRTIGTRWMSIQLFLLTALFNHCLLRPSSSVYAQMARRNAESMFVRFRRAIWIGSIVIPVLFAGLSLGGYLETAFQLGRSLQLTFLLLVGLIVVAGLVDRMFRLRRREESRLAHLKMLESLPKTESSGTDADGEPSVAVSDIAIQLEDESTDVETLDRQSRQLATLMVGGLAAAGLTLIWKDVFPAVAFLDGLSIYSTGEGETLASVSLLDMLLTLVVGGVLYYAVRNLPGLIEFVVLRRTSLDPGAKYAITTLLRYVLLIIGSIVLLDRLRIPYEQLGWLLAAASVGLGFGLQEIVANFVSGIILLLERPVRVGDVVTIDGQTGLVSKIQMRSTTVTNWDRKELVIPNKDLITEKLLNWSLSNVVNRLVLNVGVAYGSDPDLVRRLLYEAVASHPDVLPDPGPMVNLDSFGDSSLNFVIRCFLPNLDNRIDITHQLNTAIANRFAKAGVEIPFPQMDVHWQPQDTSPRDGKDAADHGQA